MPKDYEILAPIYDRIGMGQFATAITPRLLTYAQQNEWLGRRILDLGCGTGASLLWLAGGRQGYTVTGVDSSSQMLTILQNELADKNLSVTLQQQDIRALNVRDSYDMVLALDVMNELENLKYLEAVFKNVHSHLGIGKIFIFDLHTIGGLAQRGQMGDQIITNESDLGVFLRNSYDYERQVYTGDYTVFHLLDDAWRRDETNRVLRAYPTQAVATLLQRSGFKIIDVLDDQLNPNAVLRTTSAQRAIFAATRQ